MYLVGAGPGDPGCLTLRGRECLSSLHEQSLVARRLQDFHQIAETRLEFQPTRFTQFAGLVCWYDTRMYYYLRVTHDEKRGKVLGIVLSDDGIYDELEHYAVVINDWRAVYLRAEIDYARLQFSASPDGAPSSADCRRSKRWGRRPSFARTRPEP